MQNGLPENDLQIVQVKLSYDLLGRLRCEPVGWRETGLSRTVMQRRNRSEFPYRRLQRQDFRAAFSVHRGGDRGADALGRPAQGISVEVRVTMRRGGLSV
jgi:hypothetical protein